MSGRSTILDPTARAHWRSSRRSVGEGRRWLFDKALRLSKGVARRRRHGGNTSTLGTILRAGPLTPQSSRRSSARWPPRPTASLFASTPWRSLRRRGLGGDSVIAALVHAARLGLFDLSWNVLGPGCGGVLEAGAALKTLNREDFYCSVCAAGYAPTLRRISLEAATFTVNPRVRRLAAHDPDTLPHTEYMRQIFWCSGMDLPDELDSVIDRIVLDVVELQPGEKATLSLTLPAAFFALLRFGDAYHGISRLARRADVGATQPGARPQRRARAVRQARVAAGTLRIAIENRSARRTLPGVWVHNDDLDRLFSRRRPFLTATGLIEQSKVSRHLPKCDA